MSWQDRIALFSYLDGAAVLCLLICWLGIGWRIENPANSRISVSLLMQGFRRDWMVHMLTRQPRLFDGQVLSSLRQGTTFFASASMIAIGGGLALIGNADQLAGLARDLTLDSAPTVVWEVKILAVLLFQANAFLKYVWVHRLFGYCAVLMAAVPNDPEDPVAQPRARQAAEINITAARSFNQGMRSTYFALAALAWLLGPVALIVAALLTTGILWRREFASRSRRYLLQTPPSSQQ
ncbi:DUF599 domain-containing protein [Heliomarina baculiformis]|uniref:DUF599 domain-containing protein n=1 Tax=Heliomarina baculiformis TaxID=2872036 RepID=UPI001EE2AE5C|nr:DUF599 domain-containing protein [Heliomarina baculiformis]